MTCTDLNQNSGQSPAVVVVCCCILLTTSLIVYCLDIVVCIQSISLRQLQNDFLLHYIDLCCKLWKIKIISLLSSIINL